MPRSLEQVTSDVNDKAGQLTVFEVKLSDKKSNGMSVEPDLKFDLYFREDWLMR